MEREYYNDVIVNSMEWNRTLMQEIDEFVKYLRKNKYSTGAIYLELFKAKKHFINVEQYLSRDIDEKLGE